MPSILFLKNPEYWKDPEEFDPMRLGESEEALNFTVLAL